MNKKASFLAYLIGLLVLPSFVFAQTIQFLICNVVNRVVWPIAIGIVVVLWIVTGALFLMSLGDPGKLGTAKNSLFASLGGTIIIILAGSIITIISNALGTSASFLGC
ncbi:MAG: hypothetical protein HYT35_01230 [Candidatus Staskawiczbacteria bacterium]|nr:hypothetical protein [Candidatus Staskawiczbacteria bacterium]